MKRQRWPQWAQGNGGLLGDHAPILGVCGRGDRKEVKLALSLGW